MKVQEQRILKLLEKFEQGQATSQDMEELEVWYQSFESNKDITNNLNNQEEIDARESLFTRILSSINSRLQPEQHLQSANNYEKQQRLWPRIIAAAAILIFLSIGGYFLLQQRHADIQMVENLGEDFEPGSNKAVLTLGGGEKIVLTGTKNGQLATQGDAIITKTADGELVYGTSRSGKGKVVYNTISTPRGGQYHLTLADGTVAWINAASSITYPATFSGKDRAVEITGEVYFEVAHNAAKPFKVKSRGQTVEVLGTHFNVNAYADENEVKTTLLEGSVRVSSLQSGIGKAPVSSLPNNGVILKPNQQSSITINNEIKVKNVNAEDVIAWKNGLFLFDQERLENIMRQVARWYNVDVQYTDKNIANETFSGTVTRFANISIVLKRLEVTGDVKFKIEGRRVIMSR